MHRPSNFNNNRGGPPQGRPTNRAAGAPQRRGPPVPQVAGGGQRGRFGASKVGRNSGFNCSLEEFRVKLKESLARDPPTLNDVHVTARYGDERDHQQTSRAVDFNASGAQKTPAFCESTVAPPPAMPPTIDEEEEEPLEAAVEAFAPADPFREHLWAAHQAGAGNTLALKFDHNTIKVSPMIAAAASPLLAHQIAAAGDTRRLELSAVPLEAGRAVVEFAYRGRLEHFDAQRASALYDVACQLQMRELATACIRALESHFTPENITEFAVRGLSFGDPEMRAAALDFLSSNATLMDVLMAESFHQLAAAGGEAFAAMKALLREAREAVHR
ncbi:hypothetical protein M3Y99_00447600 [Aphelenchoides fujianensis]|nr:hypothetical protein M3Y99_00447600 [Aphelenchoides fujianensis]